MSLPDRRCFNCGTMTYQARSGRAICPLCGFGSGHYQAPLTASISETPQHHAEAFQLLDLAPAVSEEQIWALRRVEYLLQQPLPASFVEWFSRPAAADLLPRWLHGARLLNLEREAQQLAEPILPFLVENQGVCRWGIALDDGEDPLVLVEIEDAYWQTCASRFSQFVHWAIRDTGVIEASDFLAHTPLLTRDCLHLLRETFFERPQTYGWPGKVNYRFHHESGELLIWEARTQTDWWIAPQDGQAHTMLEQVWGCEHIPDSLFGLNDEATRILKQFRQNPRGGNMSG